MAYTKTLLPGESVPELARKMPLVTDIYLGFGCGPSRNPRSSEAPRGVSTVLRQRA